MDSAWAALRRPAGDEPFQHEVVIHLGEAELLAGRYDSAEHWLGLAHELGTQLNTGLVGETWLLVAGLTHRRARRKQAARNALSTALDEFTALGARARAQRVAEERERIGARTTSASDLSATEERVARLAAEGRTNRAIADELYISPKTVESNLVRAYRKLGITRRAELGVALGRRDA